MRKDRMEYDCECDICRAQMSGNAAEVVALMKHLAAAPPPRHMRAIEKHVAGFVGPLWHVLSSDRCDAAGAIVGRMNVLFFEPTPERPYQMLVTAGLSDLPLCPPPGSEFDLAWAEFAICLPADWKFERAQLDPDRWDWGPQFWPVRLLFDLASMVHQDGSWIWYHHTMEFGDRATLAEGVAFDSLMFCESEVMPEEFQEIALPGGKQIHILSLVPLLAEELAFAKERGGPHVLLDRLEAAGVTDLVVPGRTSCL